MDMQTTSYRHLPSVKLCRSLTISLAFVATIGCAGGVEEGASSEPNASFRQRPSVPPPSDPETLVTMTAMKWDAARGWVVAATETVTKAVQWQRLHAPPKTSPSSTGSNVELRQNAIAAESCSHGSQIVLFDDVNFGGKTICFNQGGDPWAAIYLADIPFVAKSMYSLVDLYAVNANWGNVITWCTYGAPIYNSADYIPWPGVIHYIYAPAGRYGQCAF
jgi:hypothetical protein